MSSLRKTFKTNKDNEANGVNIEVGVNEYNGQPIVINLSRMGTSNKKYTKRLEAVMQPHQSALQNDTMDNELAGRLLREVFADTVLNGWSNLPRSELTGDDGHTDDLPFTRENVLALFNELPEMYADWEGRAKRIATFRDQVREAIAGN